MSGDFTTKNEASRCEQWETQRAQERFSARDAPALVDVVHSQCAETEDEEHGNEHVVDGSDVADLEQLTDTDGEDI